MRVSLLILLSAAVLSAQVAKFEAASIKLNTSGARATNLGFLAGGRFIAENEPLWRLIAEAYQQAYQLRRFEIVGIPQAMENERYDVEAVAQNNPSPAEQKLMLQQLLAERFKLATHWETRDLPVYDLVRAKADGAIGERLHPSVVDCSLVRAGSPPPPPIQPGQSRPCMMIFGQGLLSSNGLTITNLAEMGLSRSLDRPVIDRTGLQGGFAWTLEWTPDPSGALEAQNGTAVNREFPSLPTALREQLGLKLEQSHGPVQILVVDRAEKPIEN